MEDATPVGTRRAWWVTLGGPVAVGLLAAAISLARILVTNSTALSTLVWAEDGLFPLCVRKADALTCLMDPFAGYLLLLPRAVAALVALLPLEQWAWATNLAAAVLAGLASAFVFMVLRRIDVHAVIAVLVALLPVLAPIAGFEAVQTIGNVYMLLLFVMAICLAFPASGRPALAWYSVGLVVTALTIPSAVVLFIPILVLGFRRLLPLRHTLVLGIALAAGLIGQMAVVLTAPSRRNMGVTLGAVADWVDSMPNAVLTFWPGLSFGEATVFGQFALHPFGWTGALVVLVALGVGLWLAAVGTVRNAGVGMLLLVGLGSGAIPALTGYANNRYYVVTCLLWAAAALIALDGSVARRRTLVFTVLAAGLVVLWSPAFATNPWRANAWWETPYWVHGAPRWWEEVEQFRAICAQDPAANVDLYFSPDWPMPETVLTEPTTTTAKCVEIR